MKNEENNLSSDKNELSTHLSIYEEEELNIKEQIRNLGEVLEPPSDADFSNSFSLSMSMSKTKPKNIFSIKEKVYFSKLGSFIKEYEELKE